MGNLRRWWSGGLGLWMLWVLTACDGRSRLVRPALRQPLPPAQSATAVAWSVGEAGLASGQSQSAAAVLPVDEGPYFPSLLAIAAPMAPSMVDAWADVSGCTSCHQAAGAHWAASAHAHASFDNPWYRASVDQLRQDVGWEASRHCAGCHDPLPLLAGAMDRPIQPADPLATAGVTCLVCHSVQATRSDGNGALVLNTAPVPIPIPGDGPSLAAHRARLAMPALRSVGLCGSCHRGFLGPDTGNPHPLFGMDEPGAYRASAFGGSRGQTLEDITERSCNDCHMPAEQVLVSEPSAQKGHIKSHRFAGGQTPLAAAVDPGGAQLEAIRAGLRQAVRLDVPVLHVNGQVQPVTDPVRWQRGDEVALDATIRSLAVGHAFPGGLKDTQDTWLALQVVDGRGQTVAQFGAQAASEHASEPDGQAASEHVSEPDGRYVLRALVVNKEGRPETQHRVPNLQVVAYDHTVPAHGARVVRYRFALERKVKPPLQVRLRLYHRRHRQALREAACEASRSRRGRAFAAAARRQGEPVIDGCAEEPVMLVAATELSLGEPAAGWARPSWERLYDHALGLSGAVQEALPDAVRSAEWALVELGSAGPRGARANLLCLLGRLRARQGRLAEALGFAARAEALVGLKPAIARVRADAYLRTWDFAAAAEVLALLVEQSPFDTGAHRDLARARYSAGDLAGALSAAQAGLALQPRDEGLLRTQALVLRAWEHGQAEAAQQAFLRYRVADWAQSARLACDRTSPGCARDRLPVVELSSVGQ